MNWERRDLPFQSSRKGPLRNEKKITLKTMCVYQKHGSKILTTDTQCTIWVYIRGNCSILAEENASQDQLFKTWIFQSRLTTVLIIFVV